MPAAAVKEVAVEVDAGNGLEVAGEMVGEGSGDVRLVPFKC